MWGKKGQVILYGLMLSLVIIVVALALAKPVTDFSTTAMNNTTESSIGLNCTNESISNFDKGACVVVDLYPAYFIGVLIFIGGAILISKIIFDN